MTDAAQKIREQLEYYFSDANLARDKFMREQLKASKDGAVALDVLFKFKRLAALTTDASAWGASRA